MEQQPNVVDDESVRFFKKCCIKRCKTGKNSDEKVALFSAPLDDETFKKWAQTCRVSGTLLTKASFVCEKHFLPEQIKKNFILKDKAGNVVFKTPLNKYGLEEGSVPSIFDGKQVPIMDTIQRPFYDTEIEFMTNNNAFDHFLSNRVASTGSGDHSVGQNGKNNLPKKPDNIDKVIEEVVAYGRTHENLRKSDEDNFVAHINNVAVKYDVIADADLVNILNVKPFNILFNSTKDIALPSALWGCHKSSVGQEIIVFSKIKWFENEIPMAPIYEMQLVFYKSNVIKLFAYNLLAQIEIECPMSVEEMESILQQADSLKLCAGGPSVNQYWDAFSRSAFKDVINRWRSKDCPLIISSGMSCNACEKLYTSLRKHSHADTVIQKKKRKGKCPPTEEERHAITTKINSLKSDMIEAQCEMARLSDLL